MKNPIMERAMVETRNRLGAAAGELGRSLDLLIPPPEGKLLRPLVAYARSASAASVPPPPVFWAGALAIQMVHEASLLHDDILDGAELRRHAPTVASGQGLGTALVLGDRLLTSAYRIGASTGSLPFLTLLAFGADRTVAGEMAQGSAIGQWLTLPRYRAIVTAKSGELFGVAFALPGLLAPADGAPGSGTATGRPEGCAAAEPGRRLGCLYQMVDDFLDFCPGAGAGKQPLRDYEQEKWTWPLAYVGVDRFGWAREELLDHIFTPAPDDSGPVPLTPMHRAIAVLRTEAESVRRLLAPYDPSGLLRSLVEDWMAAAQAGLEAESRSRTACAPGRKTIHPGDASGRLRSATAFLDDPAGWSRHFASQGRSFRFAARLLPREPRRRVAGVYAYCRFTDDLVDAGPERTPEARRELLERWRDLSRSAYEGRTVGIPLLDEVMGFTAREEVPFRYVEELLRGVEMDLGSVHFPDLEALRGYSYRVAGAVGLWLTELFEVRDPWVLERAEALGHAMQLTNILRDVGEDALGGRIYLPEDHLTRHGVDPAEIAGWARGEARPGSGWGNLMEELMDRADGWYEEAFPAILQLPDFFQRPVAVAARVYQGIHTEIRRSGYDVFARRRATSFPRKLLVGSRALVELHGVRWRNPAGRGGAPPRGLRPLRP